MRVSTFDGKRFELLAENAADQQLLDAIDMVGHISLGKPLRKPVLEDGQRMWVNSGREVVIAHDDPGKLVADTGRQAVRSLGDLLRLYLRETACDSHVGAPPADPQSQESLAAVLKELKVVIQALRAVIDQRKLVVEEVVGSHGAPSNPSSVGHAGSAS